MLSLLPLLGSVKNDASIVIFNTSVFRVYIWFVFTFDPSSRHLFCCKLHVNLYKACALLQINFNHILLCYLIDEMGSLHILFFLWFPLYRDEAGLYFNPMYGYFCDSFALVTVVGIFSPFFFLLCFSHISLHAVLPS